MSLLGFDALGRDALGQITPGNIVLSAVSGSFTVSGVASAFSLSEAVTVAAFTVSAPSVSQVQGVTAGSFALTGQAQTFVLTENVDPGAYVITGSLSNNINGAADPGSYVLTGLPPALIWTGAGVDTSYTGGVGHFLEEIERQKQLNAITRNIPPPIDRRTQPRFVAPAPVAAPTTSPVIDLQAMQAQADAAHAAAVRRRRDEEAILLLAS